MAEPDTFPPGMSRADRRRFKRLAEETARVLEGDRRYFARHPARNHRLRLMARSERQQIAITNGKADVLPPAGKEWVMAVMQIRPGVRCRMGVTLNKGADLDQDEATCRAVYELMVKASPQAQRVDASMRETFGASS